MTKEIGLPFPLDLSQTEFNVQRQVYEKFGLNYKGPARQLDKYEKQFYIDALKEEVIEYIAADNIEDEYDAILDVITFAFDVLIRMGLPFQPGFIEVVKANYAKEIAGSKSVSKRDWEFDLVKPKGWTAPDLKGIIKKAQEK
jgi:hypothetical protein